MIVFALLYIVYDFCVPRFVNEDVALEHSEGAMYTPIVPMRYVGEDEVFDGVALMNSFVWLGRAWWTKQIGEVRPWGK